MVLQMKEGYISVSSFHRKFKVNILEEFAEPFHNQQDAGYLTIEGNDSRLTRKGLVQATMDRPG